MENDCAAPARSGRRGVSRRGCGACTAGIAYPRHAGAGERGSPGMREAEESCVRHAGNGQKKFFGYLSRGSGTEVSASAARDGCTTRIQRISPARSRVTDSSGSRAERAQPMKESRKRSFPRPRGGQDAFRGKILREVRIPPPQVLRQGDGSCPPAAERVARLWAPPAPSRRASRGSAGGGFPGFADFTTWDRSATAQ